MAQNRKDPTCSHCLEIGHTKSSPRCPLRPVRILNERFLNKSPTKKILSYLRNYSIWIASCLKSVHIFGPH